MGPPGSESDPNSGTTEVHPALNPRRSNTDSSVHLPSSVPHSYPTSASAAAAASSSVALAAPNFGVTFDRAVLTLGIETSDVFHPLIPRGTRLPAVATHLFSTYADNQPGVSIMIYQGQRASTRHNHFLGRFDLLGIRPAARGVPRIEVTFSLDRFGLLRVAAKETTDGSSYQLMVQHQFEARVVGWDEDAAVAQIVRDAEMHRAEDERVMARSAAKSRLEQYVYGLRTTLEQPTWRNMLSPDEIALIQSQYEACAGWLREHELHATQDDFQRRLHAVMYSCQPAVLKMYEGAAAAAAASGAAEDIRLDGPGAPSSISVSQIDRHPRLDGSPHPQLDGPHTFAPAGARESSQKRMIVSGPAHAGGGGPQPMGSPAFTVDLQSAVQYDPSSGAAVLPASALSAVTSEALNIPQAAAGFSGDASSMSPPFDLPLQQSWTDGYPQGTFLQSSVPTSPVPITGNPHAQDGGSDPDPMGFLTFPASTSAGQGGGSETQPSSEAPHSAGWMDGPLLGDHGGMRRGYGIRASPPTASAATKPVPGRERGGNESASTGRPAAEKPSPASTIGSTGPLK